MLLRKYIKSNKNLRLFVIIVIACCHFHCKITDLQQKKFRIKSSWILYISTLLHCMSHFTFKSYEFPKRREKIIIIMKYQKITISHIQEFKYCHSFFVNFIFGFFWFWNVPEWDGEKTPNANKKKTQTLTSVRNFSTFKILMSNGHILYIPVSSLI